MSEANYCAIPDLKAGDHLCCLYETEEEHRAVLTSLLRQGLERGEKVIYIVDTHTAEVILGYLRDDGLDVEWYLARDQLVILPGDDIYMREGVFDPERMIILLQREAEHALGEGYSALRITGEMTWALREFPDSKRLIEYEGRLNQFLPNSQCLAICQYDRRHFAPATLLDVLCTHPIAVVGTEVCDNFYYVPSDGLLGHDLPTAQLYHWLQNLAEQKQVEEERARWREGETLRQAAAAVMETLSLDERLERILEQLDRVVPYDSASVLLLRDGYLEIIGGRGFRDPEAIIGLTFPVPGDNPNTAVIQEQRPVILADAPAAHPPFREPPHDHIRSWLGAPLIVHEQVIGMLAVDSTELGRFNEEHARLIIPFANQVAVAIDNARLYEEVRQRVAELEALRRTSLQLTSSLDPSAVLDSIAESTLALVGATDCHIYLYDEVSETFTFGTALWEDGRREAAVKAPRRDGLTATVAQQGRAIVINDAAHHPLYTTPEAQEWGLQAIAGFPLKRAEQVLGVFTIAFREPHTFTEEEIRVLGLLADQAAIAIENARLFQETERLRAFNESIVHSVAEAILMEDAEGILTFANPAAQELLGYSGDELAGLHWSAIVPEDQREKVRQEMAKRPQGIESHYETALLSKEGQVIPVIVSAQPLFEEGKFVGVLSAFTDITEHRRIEERMRGQDRLAAVGQLAAGIAHDFNNILTSMIGFAQLVHMRADVPKSAKADLKQVMEGGQRAAHLIRQILDFSRRSLISPQPLDLVPFLKEAIKFLQRTIPERIHIVLEMGPDEYWVQADPAQIQQVLTNLAVNARDAMPRGGELRFRLSRFTLKPGAPRPFPSMESGEWITLFVSDTGTGIPPEVVPHLYEPFFTTKAPGEGTGLGLAQVYGIVKQHGGFIDVETEVGKGTTFIIYLPPLAVQEKAPKKEVSEAIGRGQDQLILLVEDEPQVVGVGKAMLEHLGYRVLTASTGLQALEVYERHREEVALVLADMVMPQMGGVELFRALSDRDPEVRMVLMTGYPLVEKGQELLAQGIVDWIRKPLDLVQLARVVKQALK